MIEWNPGSDAGPVVSPYMWLYWAISIPLTVLVVVVWRIWLSWEDKRFKQEEADAKRSRENSVSAQAPSRQARRSLANVSLRQHV